MAPAGMRLLSWALLSGLAASQEALTAATMPTALQVFYQRALSSTDVLTAAEIDAFMHEDWNSHPNIITPGAPGPGSAGFPLQLQAFKGAITNLTFTTQEVLHLAWDQGDKYLHIGAMTGTPVQSDTPILPATGKSFNVMTIDLHWVVDGRLKETWHVEDWVEAFQQVTAEGGPQYPPLQSGQPFNAGGGPDGVQTGPGMALPVADGVCSSMAGCLQGFYYRGLTATPNLTQQEAQSWKHDDWDLHPNLLTPGAAGPGSAGIYALVSGFFAATVPNLRFQSEQVFKVPCVVGDKYIHVGVATGTPVAEFLGVPPEVSQNKSFIAFALDVHWVVDGQTKETWHVEEWINAIQQLSAPGAGGPVPRLHSGQPLNLGELATPGSVTCGELRRLSRESACCGNPSRTVDLGGLDLYRRRLAATSDWAALKLGAGRALQEARAAGGAAKARQLAEELRQVADRYLEE